MLPQGAPVGLAEGRTALAAGLAFSALCGPATAKPLRGSSVGAALLLGLAFGGDGGGYELASWPLKGRWGHGKWRLSPAWERISWLA